MSRNNGLAGGNIGCRLQSPTTKIVLLDERSDVGFFGIY